MSNMRPFFLTGANAKIKINGKTMAFCSELSYSVQIITQTPKILGMYEGSSVEPLGYTVSGSFTLIRYIKNAKNKVGGKAPNTTKKNGNGIANWSTTNLLGDQDIQLNPGDLEFGSTFDIQVYQKTNNGDIGVVNIRNVRISQADASIGKRSILTQRFNFVALYADEDSFRADFSGRGQHF